MARTVISSDTYPVPASRQEVYTWLSDLRNFEKLMPAGKISNWEATREQCSFIIKGMSAIGMEISPQSRPPEELRFKSTSRSPIRFELHGRISEDNENSRIRFDLEADMTPFVKMMAEKPLTAFFDALAANIAGRIRT